MQKFVRFIFFFGLFALNPSPAFAFLTDPCPVGSGGVAYCQTGLGITIPTDPSNIAAFFFAILLSLSGGIALILIIVSGYQMMVSSGNPEKLQGARETLTSAIAGLLFIIFSLVILETIGVNILHIPGLAH